MRFCGKVEVRRENSIIMKVAGFALIIIGAILIILFAPVKVWLVLLGAALILAGVLLQQIS